MRIGKFEFHLGDSEEETKVIDIVYNALNEATKTKRNFIIRDKKFEATGDISRLKNGYMLDCHRSMKDLSWVTKRYNAEYSFELNKLYVFLENKGIHIKENIFPSKFENDICIIKKTDGKEQRFYIEYAPDFTHSIEIENEKRKYTNAKTFVRDGIKKFIFEKSGYPYYFIKNIEDINFIINEILEY